MTILKNYFRVLEKETALQYLAGFLIVFVYAGSLFFPLIDKDAAHHANIALYMYEHDNPFILVDRGSDYLDKPHFLFWSTLACFKIFGVNTFSHRLPAVIFALITVYSVYKLARHLSDRPTAKLAALIIATAQFIMQSVVDARMETPLAAAISFGLWQLIVYIDKEKIINIVLAALGTAIAFSTKGWLGPVVIFLTAFFYILLNKKWKVLLKPKTWLFVPVFAICISPVLYGYYLQFDLHPEKVIRDKANRSGVRFILWDQLFERYKGFDGGRHPEYFFLYHTFLWGFFPWSLLAYFALYFWLKRMFYQKRWRTTFGFAALSFAFILFVISFSKFKMAHYVVMLLPLAALFTAPALRILFSTPKSERGFLTVQAIVAILVLLLAIPVNFYFFTPQNALTWIAGGLLLCALVFLLVKKQSNKAMKIVLLGAVTSIALNFFMNYNFFPQLMKYQGGNELVKKMKRDNIAVADSSIISLEQHAHTFDFYRKHNHTMVEAAKLDSVYPLAKDKYYLFTMPYMRHFFDSTGYTVQPVAWAKDYNVARLTLRFLNPKTRDKRMDTLVLARLVKQ
jgi:4-amino-4-deoxy-L-arabinose transferase-like glycosyltransferase